MTDWSTTPMMSHLLSGCRTPDRRLHAASCARAGRPTAPVVPLHGQSRAQNAHTEYRADSAGKSRRSTGRGAGLPAKIVTERRSADSRHYRASCAPRRADLARQGALAGRRSALPICADVLSPSRGRRSPTRSRGHSPRLPVGSDVLYTPVPVHFALNTRTEWLTESGYRARTPLTAR
jgi:hypothetical protein